MFLKTPAIEIDQPLGKFYITKIKAKDLLKITYSDPLRIDNSKGDLVGNQRLIVSKRLKEIEQYIKTIDAAFPNAIIISANYSIDGKLCTNDLRWNIESSENQGFMELIVPSEEKLGAIIDGQHRLGGFLGISKEVENIEKCSLFKSDYYNDCKERLDMDLLCAIYLDLPSAYQAYIFATINFNQKKVDKSLAYELFGYNLEDEEFDSWSPDKLAVYLTRKLNTNTDSPFYNHIKLAPQIDKILFSYIDDVVDWKISTATIVDGIISLISSKPKEDGYEINKKGFFNHKTRKDLIGLRTDNSPLRKYYIDGNDKLIYNIVYNYFSAANDLLFKNSSKESYINKTVGIQGLFDFLKYILINYLEIDKDISIIYYSNILYKLKNVDFADPYFQASGVGRGRIKNIFLYKNGYKTNDDFNIEDIKQFNRVLKTS